MASGIQVVGVFEYRNQAAHSHLEIVLPFLAVLIFGCAGALPLLWQVATSPLLLIVFLNTGGRAAIAGVVAFSAFSIFTKLGAIRLLILTPLVAIGAAAAYYASRIARSVGLAGLTDWQKISFEIHNNLIEQHGGENIIARAYLFSVALVEGDHWKPAAQTIRRLLFLYVPRSWGIQDFKAEDVTYRLFDVAVEHDFFYTHPYNWYFKKLHAEGGTGSLHPIVWGEGELTLGIWFLLVYPLALAWILTRWDHVAMRVSVVMDYRILLGVLAPSYIYLVRGSVSIAITSIAVTVPLLWLSCWGVWRLRLRRRRDSELQECPPDAPRGRERIVR